MYIYLNNSREMRRNLIVNPNKESNFDILEFKDCVVYVLASSSYPHVNTKDAEIESLIENECLKEFFLKAVDIVFPDFSKSRKSGIYNYGSARAELKNIKGKMRLKIESSSLSSLKDMVVLQEMIYAGTIRPAISYENRQLRMLRIFLAKFK